MREFYSTWNEWEHDAPIPDELMAVTWCYGDLSQIKTVVNEQQQETELNQKSFPTNIWQHDLLKNNHQIFVRYSIY